jgi:uncharacterized protein involved in exopolysaccharide biosynthesis
MNERRAALLRLQRREIELRARAEAAERKVLQFSARIDGLEARMQLLDALASGEPPEPPGWLS